MKQPLPTYGRNFVRRKTSFVVLPHSHFSLIVRETLWKNLGDLLRMEVISNRDFLRMSLIASAQVGPFSKLPRVFQFSLSSVSSNNAAYNR